MDTDVSTTISFPFRGEAVLNGAASVLGALTKDLSRDGGVSFAYNSMTPGESGLGTFVSGGLANSSNGPFLPSGSMLIFFGPGSDTREIARYITEAVAAKRG